MLTKKLKFDDGVLSVLRGMQFSDDGKLGIITGGQLERVLYERVNKALAAMGGKWNRKDGGHVFPTDPRPQVEGLIENGEMTVERDGFFETPRAVVERMLELAPLPWMDEGAFILEPSAGLGAIARIISEDHHFPTAYIWCVEKNSDRSLKLRDTFEHVFCCDFLSWNAVYFDRVYMNPPFEEGQDIDHVRHAYDLLADGGMLVSVMSEGPFFRNDRKAVEFRDWLAQVGGVSECLPEGSFKKSGTGVNTRLVRIAKE